MNRTIQTVKVNMILQSVYVQYTTRMPKINQIIHFVKNRQPFTDQKCEKNIHENKYSFFNEYSATLILEEIIHTTK